MSETVFTLELGLMSNAKIYKDRVRIYEDRVSTKPNCDSVEGDYK